LDPKYAVAYAELGWNYFAGVGFALNPDPNGLVQSLRLEQRALALDDSLATAHCALAMVDTAIEEHDQAEVEAQRAIALDPNYPQAYEALAGILDNEVKPTEALIATEKAMRLDPRNADNYVGSEGWAFMEMGRWNESIPALKRGLARLPNIYYQAFLANDYSALGDEDAARAEVAEVERVVALTPNSSAGYVPLSWALNSIGKPAEALVAVNNAIRLDPRKQNFCVCHLWFRGIAYTLLGQWQRSIDAFKRHLAHFANNFWAHAYLAVDYAELGHDEAARAEVAEVRRLDPQFTVDTVFPMASLDHKAFPAEVDRFRADLHKAGLN
jgi:tetratricopeptide (TPR) repeat protein